MAEENLLKEVFLGKIWRKEKVKGKKQLNFVDIIEEERSYAESAVSGHDTKWYIEKRLRSSSIEKIQGEQQKIQKKEAKKLLRFQREEEMRKKEEEDIALAIKLSMTTIREERKKERSKVVRERRRRRNENNERKI
eukprot:CAMPEP_0171467682 /NCGR_PEP_ID=MMETSP0945-20130129/10132_1 /TAXON_ID=109269 /ORGANISM="Vaucheria litorea, Strain CCMP2940" /LENGTH=135 /DNA_ID=CAMNT_0011996277 /DNA_START=458 /DNA_END=865 /DNA_ORIENTATION=-